MKSWQAIGLVGGVLFLIGYLLGVVSIGRDCGSGPVCKCAGKTVANACYGLNFSQNQIIGLQELARPQAFE